MAEPCNRKNPLSRNGSRQGFRVPAAQDPDYFKVDERSLADLILYAQDYSEHIAYYKEGISVAENWYPFFSADLTATLAGILKIPAPLMFNFANALHTFLEKGDSLSDLELARHLKLYFHLPLMLLREAGKFFALLPDGYPLKVYIENHLKEDLNTSAPNLIRFYNGAKNTFDFGASAEDAKDAPLDAADYNTTFNGSLIPLPSKITNRLDLAHRFAALDIRDELFHWAGVNGWQAYTAQYPKVDTTPYEIGTTVHQKIVSALNYNPLITALHKLFHTTQWISLEAQKYFDRSLNGQDDHSPHYGLWLSFLKLFRNNQDHLNEFTRRHLDYYYRDILKICPRAAVPDKAHLLFELSKNRKDHLLTRGTLFKAGKDSAGKEVNYQLDADFVANRAQVDRLMSFYVRETASGLVAHASTATNSRDGEGQEFLPTAPHWEAFGPDSTESNAHIGFAVADRQLFLREGTREINLVLKLSHPPEGPLHPDTFKVFLTGEEGWVEAPDSTGETHTRTVETQLGVDGKTVVIKTILQGEDPPVVPYDPKLHEGKFETPWPMLRVEFNFNHSGFQQFRDATFDSMELSVAVTGAKDVFLANEKGPINLKKPFQPFGPMPEKNSFLILGSSEIFSKPTERIVLDIEWKEFYPLRETLKHVIGMSYKLSFQHLESGEWEGNQSQYRTHVFQNNINPEEVYFIGAINNMWDYLLDHPTLKNQFDQIIEYHPFIQFFEQNYNTFDYYQTMARPLTFELPDTHPYQIEQSLENPSFSNTARSGYIRLSLNQGFGHKEYPSVMATATMHKAKGDSLSDYAKPAYSYNSDHLPHLPWTPEANGLTVKYTTRPTSPVQFFHLYPFGHRQESPDSGALLAEFPDEGELYIGLKDLKPPQKVSMLFQTLEGSANPLKKETPLKWQYLCGDEWRPFPEGTVQDTSRNLSGTGIISIGVPADADLEHIILPQGWHWLKLSVERDADAMNDLLSINAQAAQVSFRNQDNAADYLVQPLATGTISKLKVSDSAVKKITQAGDSFGGKPVEKAEHYSTRVSERLRHKDRASTIWDYEHLILEEFPEIYRVRCLNHTELVRDSNNHIIADNGLKPGHVLVVPIPFINAETAIDPRRPYTRKKTLGDIEAFLKRRVSPFVRLEVQNPKIEEVEASFQVAFHSYIQDTQFYVEMLQDALMKFLTPWAFEERVEISFGGKWHKSSLINFVEEQPYVDYVKNFYMYHREDIEQDENLWMKLDTDVIEATTSRSILVSRERHNITPITSGP